MEVPLTQGKVAQIDDEADAARAFNAAIRLLAGKTANPDDYERVSRSEA